MGKFTYLGIDESTIGIGRGSAIVVVAETTDRSLATVSTQYDELRKAKDYIREAEAYKAGSEDVDPDRLPRLPGLDSMFRAGLGTFHWTRTTGGRFKRQVIQHASIANLVSSNGYSPRKTVLLIDGFYGNHQKSIYLIEEFLHRHDFKIPRKNIDVHYGADKNIPIVNMADLLAFQIGLFLNEKHRAYYPERKQFPIAQNEIDFDEQRFMGGISNEQRDELETIIANWLRGEEKKQ